MSTQTNPQTTDQSSLSQQLWEMILGFQVSQLIHVAAMLGLADVLKDGPKSCEDLAQAVGAHPCMLYRVLRMLASVGIFAEQEDGRFNLTPLATYLQTDVPGSVRGTAMLYGEEWFWRPYGALLHTVQTGETAFPHVFGMGLFDYVAQHPEASELFNRGMTTATRRSTVAILAAYDFSGIGTLVDVGGGHGALITALLQAHPTMRGILFDLPHVVAGARRVIEAEGVVDRCALVAGSHLEAVPCGGDVYLLKSIIDGEDDAHATVILQNCRRAMADRGRLVLVDWVIPPGNAPSRTKVSDITMLVMVGGVVRTEAEFRALFAAAGFRLTAIVPTAAQYSILEGVPV